MILGKRKKNLPEFLTAIVETIVHILCSFNSLYYVTLSTVLIYTDIDTKVCFEMNICPSDHSRLCFAFQQETEV